MVIQWLGHASFLIASANGTKVVTDPYEPGAFGGGITYGPINVLPNVVTVSHDHADHSHIEGLRNHFDIVSQPGVKTIKGIEFRAVDSYHDAEQGAIRGTNLIFVMVVDELRVCHLGDLGHELTPYEIGQLGQVDILLIPVGGYYTIDAEQATRVVSRLSPKVVIPMHYKTEKVAFPIATVDPFLEGKPNVLRLSTSRYEITRETLPDQETIVVLRHAL